MAGYNIVLNLSGNSVSQSARLAANLAKASDNATRLATALGAVGSAARSVPANPIRVSGVANTANATSVRAAQATATAARATQAAAQSTTRAARATEVSARNTASHAYQTRHRSTRIASYGTGFNLGGFSGRLSTIIQPDAEGMILGMDANRLMRRANIAAIATNIMAGVGRGLFKLTLGSTIAPIALGGGTMMLSLRALQSESFAEGVRLISRRHQAQMGLGADYEAAQTNADYIAQGYGLDRSTTLSSINVLTGLGIGGQAANRLTLGEASNLTLTGGLISQHHGVPFERVMTNIQQLLVQQTPHMRDIRELLNQAPILQKFALREMEERGLTGIDVRTYLKDQRNILSTLETYRLNTATNAGMQARGQIALASQDMWANIAGNDPAWSYIGMQGANIIRSLGSGINGLLTTFTQNTDFQIMVKNIEIMFDHLGAKSGTFIDKLISLVDKMAQRFGFDLGDRSQAAAAVNRNDAIRAFYEQDTIRNQSYQEWLTVGNNANLNEGVREKSFNQWYSDLLRNALNSDELHNSIIPGRPVMGNTQAAKDIYSTARVDAALASFRNPGLASSQFMYFPSVGGNANRDWSNYISRNPYASYTIPNSSGLDFMRDFVNQSRAMSTGFTTGAGAGVNAGEDLTGFNRDRRALEIHFHAPIVEWNANITATNPEETVEEVADNIELIASAGIQRALLGASNKMSSRWY